MTQHQKKLKNMQKNWKKWTQHVNPNSTKIEELDETYTHLSSNI